ncbi:MAG: phosphoribosylformylglycinamidine cyclo-ligase [Gemmatimonadales bacterium]
MADSPSSSESKATSYRDAGVDLAAAEAAKQRIARTVAGTRTRWVAGTVGAFGGMVRVPEGFAEPTLVMSTDGVGTKVLVAEAAGRYHTVGEDLVNHSVNDILVHGATPLAFMDYIAGADLAVDTIADLVEGVARGCRAHEMALTGGETAQMPDVYQPGHFDLAGTIVGVVERTAAIHGDAIVPGDVLLGYASTGLHTNGYTLARRILFEDMGLAIDAPLADMEGTVADALLAIHRSYFDAVWSVIGHMHGMAHITGGGIAGNLVRILPKSTSAEVDEESWQVPALFTMLQQGGRVDTAEMREVFNLGIGYIGVLPAESVTTAVGAAERAGVETWVIGEIRTGDQEVRFTT